MPGTEGSYGRLRQGSGEFMKRGKDNGAFWSHSFLHIYSEFTEAGREQNGIFLCLKVQQKTGPLLNLPHLKSCPNFLATTIKRFKTPDIYRLPTRSTSQTPSPLICRVALGGGPVMAEEGAELRRAEVLAQLALSQFHPVSLCLSLICSMGMRPHMVAVRIKCLGLKLYVLTNHKLLPNRQGSIETS